MRPLRHPYAIRVCYIPSVVVVDAGTIPGARVLAPGVAADVVTSTLGMFASSGFVSGGGEHMLCGW